MQVGAVHFADMVEAREDLAHTEQFLNDWVCARPAAAGSPAFHELPADLQRYVTLQAETNDSTIEGVLKSVWARFNGADIESPVCEDSSVTDAPEQSISSSSIDAKVFPVTIGVKFLASRAELIAWLPESKTWAAQLYAPVRPEILERLIGVLDLKVVTATSWKKVVRPAMKFEGVFGQLPFYLSRGFPIEEANAKKETNCSNAGLASGKVRHEMTAEEKVEHAAEERELHPERTLKRAKKNADARATRAQIAEAYRALPVEERRIVDEERRKSKQARLDQMTPSEQDEARKRRRLIKKESKLRTNKKWCDYIKGLSKDEAEAAIKARNALRKERAEKYWTAEKRAESSERTIMQWADSKMRQVRISRWARVTVRGPLTTSTSSAHPASTFNAELGTCIYEVVSLYWFFRQFHRNLAKRRGVRQAGYRFQFWCVKAGVGQRLNALADADPHGRDSTAWSEFADYDKWVTQGRQFFAVPEACTKVAHHDSDAEVEEDSLLVAREHADMHVRLLSVGHHDDDDEE